MRPFQWYRRPRWVAALNDDGRPIFIWNVRALAMAYGKEAAREAVLEAEAERVNICNTPGEEPVIRDTQWYIQPR